jgi:PAS domain S-box-containing protein
MSRNLVESRSGVAAQSRMTDTGSINQSDFKRSLARILIMSFGVTLLVAVALGIEVDRNRIQGDWVFHSSEVLLDLHSAERSVEERSRSVTQYLLTRDSGQLVNYAALGRQVDDRFQLLHTAVSDNAVQTARLDSITSRYWLWEVHADQTIARSRLDTFGSAGLRSSLRMLNAEFTNVLRQFERTTDAEIWLRNDQVADYRDGSLVILLSIVGACILIGVLASIFGRRQVRRLHREFGRALELATRSRDQLMTALLSIGDAIVMTDNSGAILLMNDRAATMTGWSEKNALGKNITEIVSIVSEAELKAHPESPRPLPNMVSHALSENRQIIISSDALLINRRGLTIPIEASATPIQTKDHDKAGAVIVLRDITARREREEELFQREQTFRALVESSPDLTIRFTPDLRISFVNARVESLLGIPPRHVIGRTFEDLGVPLARRMAWTDAIERAFKTGEVGVSEIEYLTVRGVRQFSARFAPEIDQQGNIVSIISVSRDVTDAKRAERELREKEEQFRGVVENSPDAFYLLKPERDHEGKIIEFRFVYVNDRGAEITTFKKAALLSRGLKELMPGERTDAYVLECAKVVESGIPKIEEFMAHSVYVAEDATYGNATWLRSEFVKIGEMISITTSDITERKQMERSLREFEARYRRVVEGASEAIFSTDPKGRLVFSNPYICQIAGYAIEDVIGMNYLEFVALEKRPNVHRFFLKQYIQSKPSCQAEFPFMTKNGAVRWLSVTSTLRYDLPGDGEAVAGFDIIGADITNVKLEADRLRKIIQNAGMQAP